MSIPWDQSVDVGNLIDLGQEIEAAILATIELGWAEAIKSDDVGPAALEVPMTERLRDGMKVVLDRGDVPWDGLIVARGTETMSRPGMRRPDGLSDISIVVIQVFLETREHDPHAIIECKRVSQGDRRLSRAYVDKGINRFRDAKYGRNHAVGFMVGYVLSGSSTGVVGEINEVLEDYARADEVLTLVVPDRHWTSSHPRVSGVPVRLHHTLVSTMQAA